MGTGETDRCLAAVTTLTLLLEGLEVKELNSSGRAKHF